MQFIRVKKKLYDDLQGVFSCVIQGYVYNVIIESIQIFFLLCEIILRMSSKTDKIGQDWKNKHIHCQ